MLGPLLKKSRIHYAWFILFACCLMQIGSLGALGYTVGIYYTPITGELGVGRGAFALSTTLQGCCMAVFTPVAGRLCSKKHFGAQLAMAMAALCALYMVLSRNTALWQWYVLAPALGFCASFIYLLPMPILINNWFEKKTGLAMGIAAMCSGLGGAIMTPIGTHFMLEYGWRGTYPRMGLIAAALVIPAALLLIRYSPAQLGLQPYGHDSAAAPVRPDALPGTPARRALRSRAFLFVFLASGLMSFTSAYTNHYVSFANSIGMAPMVGATLASTLMVGTIALKILLGLLNDRLRVERATYVALGLVSVSYICVVALHGTAPFLYAATFLAGVGPAMMALTPSLLTRTAFGPRDYSRIFAYTTMGSSLISSLGNSVIGFIYDACGSYVPAFLLGVLVAGAAALSLRLALSDARRLAEAAVD